MSSVPPRPHRPSLRTLARWPATSAALVIGGIYLVVADRVALGPRWLVLGLIVVLVVPLHVLHGRGAHQLARTLALTLVGVVTLVVATSAIVLVTQLSSTSAPRAAVLFFDAALIWFANMLVFALWYWEVDAGGPYQRHLHGYHCIDVVFPQMTLDAGTRPPWSPSFLDYLFLAFNTSTAFSPTDTLVLSRRIKLLMMTQSLISLTVIAVLAARAVNTF